MVVRLHISPGEKVVHRKFPWAPVDDGDVYLKRNNMNKGKITKFLSENKVIKAGGSKQCLHRFGLKRERNSRRNRFRGRTSGMRSALKI